MPHPDPLTLVALPRPLLARLLDPAARDRLRRVARRLDEAADAVVLGSDLAEPPAGPPAAAGREAGVDPSIAAVTLAHLTERVGLVVAAAAQRDHPYNLARRLATLDHASRGRVGLLVSAHDPAAADGCPWTAAGPAEAAADAVTAIRELWRSFPVETVVGDRVSGLFAESHRILRVDHRGAFDVSGPLQVPTGPQVWPPVLVWADGPAADVADLVVTADPRVTVLRPASPDELERLPPLAGRAPGGTLRARLGIGPATPPATGRPAFPDPAGRVRAG